MAESQLSSKEGPRGLGQAPEAVLETPTQAPSLDSTPVTTRCAKGPSRGPVFTEILVWLWGFQQVSVPFQASVYPSEMWV